jgi:L-threonylcarbamoyladenylate synthase
VAADANIRPPTPANIAKAARLLRAGELVAFPTETVYGLGADATSDRAVAALFAAKGRPARNPLIVHVASPEAAAAIGEIDARARRLAEAFWPGALTLVLKRTSSCPVTPRVSAGLDTVAVRVPAHPLALELLRAVELPLAGPSANPSGRVSPTEAQHVADGLGDKVAMILDGGACPIGIESTVLAIQRTVELLRPGGLPVEEIEAVVGPLSRPAAAEATPRAPGQLEVHYAPELPVRLDATEVAADEALLAFGPHPPAGGAHTLNLSPAGDLDEAAANLFAMLRRLDRPQYSAIAVMPVPERGLGLAINDRLRRAAAKRP